MSSSKKKHVLIPFWVLLLAAIIFAFSATAALVDGPSWHIAAAADFWANKADIFENPGFGTVNLLPFAENASSVHLKSGGGGIIPYSVSA
jgi:hypothetical protein